MDSAKTRQNLLFVTSSLFGAASKSRELAAEFVAQWANAHPDSTVVERDLGADLPHLNLAVLTAPADDRKEAALADRLIEEVEAADTIVIAAPMYNFSIASTLKAWIDHIARAGRTFRYTAAGPEGLLKGKKVYVVTGRGGIYTGDSPARGFDFQEPYLRAVLGFLGIADVTFIHVEGLKISPEAAVAGVQRAREAIAAALAPAALAA